MQSFFKDSADLQKVVNVPRIQKSHHACSSTIPSENLSFSEVEINLDRFKWGKQAKLM